MPYGIIKVDQVTFTNAGVDQTISVSGIVASISGNITATGTISGNVIRGGTTVSGATVTGNAGQFNTITGNIASFTSGVFAAGSATTPSISFTGDDNTGIYSPGADQVAITTSGTGRLFIDSSGRLLVGTSTARSNFFGTTLSSLTQTEGTGGSTARGSLSVINNDVSNNPPYVLLGRSGAATLGSNAAVVSGSRLGTLTFHGADGTSFIEAATVAGEVDGTPGTNDMPGRLVFSTTADGAASPTERLRITSAGLVGVGTSSPAYKLHVSGDQISLDDSTGTATLNIGTTNNGNARLKFWEGGIGSGNGYSFGMVGASNALSIEMQGTGEIVRFASDGKVGVGTSSPSEILAINGASNAEARLKIQNQTTTIGYLGSHLGIVGSGNANDLILSTGGATNLTFGINTVEKVRIDSAGNVGIGTSSPAAKLHLYGSNPALFIEGDGSSYYPQFDISGVNGKLFLTTYFGPTITAANTAGTAPLVFRVGGTVAAGAYGGSEVARITSAGLVGIGTSAPAELLHVSGAANPSIQLSATNDTTPILNWASNGSDRLQISSSSVVGANINVRSNQELRLSTNNTERVRITNGGLVGIGTTSPSVALEVSSNSNLGSRAIFTRPDVSRTVAIGANRDTSDCPFVGATSNSAFAFITNDTERARIDSSGRLLVGTSTATQGGASNFSVILADFTSQFGLALCSTQAAGTANYAQFVYNGTINGSISSNGTTTTYAITSDYRLKENVIPVFDGIARFKRLKPSRFNFIGHPESTIDGFIAHEVQQVVPEAVVGEKNATNEDGTIKPQGIDQSKLVPLLTAALQEAIAKIETLEARLTSAGI